MQEFEKLFFQDARWRTKIKDPLVREMGLKIVPHPPYRSDFAPLTFACSRHDPQLSAECRTHRGEPEPLAPLAPLALPRGPPERPVPFFIGSYFRSNQRSPPDPNRRTPDADKGVFPPYATLPVSPHRVALESSSTGSFKPVFLAVISLDSR